MKPTIPVKRVILEILDYLRYQVENDRCSMEELRSIETTLSHNLDIECTAKDLSERYGQSVNNVHNALHRNTMPKGKHRTLYNFTKFIPFIPKRWIAIADANKVSNTTNKLD